LTEAAPLLRRPRDLARGWRGGGRRRTAGTETEWLSWPEGFASSVEDRDALLALSSLASLTPRRLLELAQDHETAGACLAQVRAGGSVGQADRARALSFDIELALARLDQVGGRFIPVGDPEYPQELLDLFDPPSGLFVRGRTLTDLVPRVSIVGARNCSPSGAEIARSIGAELCRAGVCVVSGGARGIDAEAHQGAMDGGGPSVAVLGCGIDEPYPRRNRALLEALARSGALVSEYPPGTRAEPFRFPARNRIVAALARGVVIVEGARGSGSMITADHALDVGREVFAVPGMVSSALAFVPLKLIREGAIMIRGAGDLLLDLGLAGTRDVGGGVDEQGSSQARVQLGRNELAVWDALGGPAAPDVLATSTGLSLPVVMAALVGLELRRLVIPVGGRYERTPGRRGGA
jgi:DNA processing protein